MVYTLRFFSSKCSLFHNSNVFGSCIIHILHTGCAKITKKNSGAKRLQSLARAFQSVPFAARGWACLDAKSSPFEASMGTDFLSCVNWSVTTQGIQQQNCQTQKTMRVISEIQLDT